MVTNERITAYLHSLDKDAKPFFDALRKHAEAEDVPIIRREMESFLRMILLIHQPEQILEIGTGIAYSTLFFADNCGSVRKIVTIENYQPRIEEARQNIESFLQMRPKDADPLSIDLLEADATTAIHALNETFDFIFLDGPKAQYIGMLPQLLKLLKEGGILLADNVLQEGDLIDSRYVTPRRQRTIHERMRDYVWDVMHRDDLESTLLTIGDGVTLSVKKENHDGM